MGKKIHHDKTLIEKLSHEITQLKRFKFAKRSEQLSPEQASLLDDLIDTDIAAIEAELESLQVIALRYNSPVITGGDNSVNYQGGFPDLETFKANRPNISGEQYAEIKHSMTYEEVLDIVKITGKESASLGSSVVYAWGNELYVYMVVTLIDGKVQSKGR